MSHRRRRSTRSRAVRRAEFADNGINFTTINMPLVRTPMIAPTKMYDTVPTLSPEEAADMIVEAIVGQGKHAMRILRSRARRARGREARGRACPRARRCAGHRLRESNPLVRAASVPAGEGPSNRRRSGEHAVRPRRRSRLHPCLPARESRGPGGLNHHDSTASGREADGFRDLRERNPHSRIPFCDSGNPEILGYTAAFP